MVKCTFLKIIRKELANYTQLSKSKDAIIKEWDEYATTFIKDYQNQLASRAHDMTTTSQLLKTSVSDSDYISKFAVKLRYICDRSGRVMKEQSLMKQERQKCLEVLHATDTNVALNDLLQAKMEELPAKLEKTLSDMAEKETTIKRLRKLMTELEHEMEEKEAKEHQLQEELAQKNERLHNLQEKVHILEVDKVSKESKEAQKVERKNLLIQRRASAGRVNLGMGMKKFERKT